MAALESATRLLFAPPRYHDAPLEYDPEIGFRGVPNLRREIDDERGRYVFQLNSEGLRGSELPDGPAAPGVQRLAFVGDSFLVGEALPETQLMTSRLEAMLRADGEQAEVYNLSTIDVGTGQELLLFDRLAPRVRPDVVVLALYPANDVINNSLLLSGATRVSGGDPIRAYLVPDGNGLRRAWAHPLRGPLRAHSRLFAMLERRIIGRSVEWLVPKARPARERLSLGLAPRAHLELFRRHYPGDRWERAWATTLELLRAFRKRCDAMGARLLVLVIPSIYQVEHWAHAVRLDAEARAWAGLPLDRLLDWNLPERRLGDFFAAEGIEARALLGPLRDATRAGRGSLYTRDVHLGAHGHEIAAEQVRDGLRTEPGAGGFGKIAGEPVRWLPDATQASPGLDFGEAPQFPQLGDGWLLWEPRDGRMDWGWRIGPSALVVLPASPGELVVRGRVPEGAQLPVRGTLAFVAGVHSRFSLTEHGAFEVRARWSREAGGVDSEGYVAILLAPGQILDARGFPLALIVQQIGFERSDHHAAAARRGSVLRQRAIP